MSKGAPPSSEVPRRSLVNREECSERIRLTDEYSRLITEFNSLLNSLKVPSRERNDNIWQAAETARALSDTAWQALEKHIAEHRCIDVQFPQPAPADTSSPDILGMAALAALDVIMVADDNQRYVDVNEAAAAVLGLPRAEIVGRRVEDFFSEVRGEPFPQAWRAFIDEGVQYGICELKNDGKPRRFLYRAKANFAPGLHLGILREIIDDKL
jgi:PAS domain-containing protein